MSGLDEMTQLAKMLEAEWNGGRIDRIRAHDLASRLLPQHPDMRATLTSVRDRMAR